MASCVHEIVIFFSMTLMLISTLYLFSAVKQTPNKSDDDYSKVSSAAAVFDGLRSETWSGNESISFWHNVPQNVHLMACEVNLGQLVTKALVQVRTCHISEQYDFGESYFCVGYKRKFARHRMK